MAPLLHADIVIITALEKEFEALVGCLGTTVKVTSHSNQQYFTCSIKHNVVALPIFCGPGQLNAAAATIKALNDLTPNWIVLVGIAGKLRDDIRLGDLLIAEQIIDYELAKLKELSKNEIRAQGYQCSSKLIDVSKSIRSTKWAAQIQCKRPDRKKTTPKLHFGTVFCGNKVVAAQGFTEELRAVQPSALGLEMEAAGVTAMLKALSNPSEFLFIKAAVDNCDGSKSDAWHPYGAEAAARFCVALLKEAAPLPPKSVDCEALKHVVQSRLAAGAKTKPNEVEERMLDAYVGKGIDVGARALSNFEVDISSGGHFLFLAKPVFQGAKRFYATSIDRVSRFWIDPKKKDAAYRYLEQHKRGAHRLFVFHDPKSLQLYARVLDEHSKKYEHVYYCTGFVYDRLLEEISRSPIARTQRDFAVLDYSTSERKSLYFAELDEDCYKWQAISSMDGTSSSIDVDAFIACFSEWETLKEGEGSKGIFKWCIGAWQNHEKWAGALDLIFGETRYDAYHLVHIRPQQNSKGHDDIKRALLDIKQAVTRERSRDVGPTMAERYHIGDVWFGENYSVRATDGRYLGDLRTGASAQRRSQIQGFILVMRFDSSEDLEHFYSDHKHSEIRQKLYQALDSRVGFIYSHMEKLKTSSSRTSAELVKVMYESIEDLQSLYVNRFDFRSAELTQHMVRHVLPVEFSPPEKGNRQSRANRKK
jgi:nucleoside phosphorylase